MKKKSWSEPALIVLVRSKPEERVLGACKATPNNGPSIQDTACFGDPSCAYCANESFS